MHDDGTCLDALEELSDDEFVQEISDEIAFMCCELVLITERVQRLLDRRAS